MKKSVCAGLFLSGIAASSLVVADCANTMPGQLMEDCIVYEGAGTSFPPSDYAHMKQYQEWLKMQQTIDQTQVLSKSGTK